MSKLPEQRAYHYIPPRAHRAPKPDDASAFRTGHSIGLHPASTPYTTTETQPVLHTRSDEADERLFPARTPTSTRRYVQVRDLRGSLTAQPSQRTHQPAIPARKLHWLLFLGLGMCLTLLVWLGGTMLLTWWQGYQINQQYGTPRTFQCDAVVGHQDSAAHPSHFIALNLHGQIEVFELPGGNAEEVKVYEAPVLMGPDQDQAPVTLSFEDVNGDGKPDLIVSVQDTRFVFINTGTAFRPSKPGDHISL